MRAIYWFLTLGPRFKSALGLASLVPGVGPAAGVVSAVLAAVGALIRAFFEGLSICLANPVVFLVIASAFGGGVWAGIDWDKHKIEVANAKVAAVHKQWKDADEQSERRLAGAMAARKAAEEAAKAMEDRAARAAADAQRLRGKLAKQPAPAPASGSSVQWFPSVLGGDGPAAPKR